MKGLGMRDKVIGMFLGVAIGDALGMSVETFTAGEIKEHLKKLGITGKLMNYLRPDGHKWFNGRGAGEWTDDWLFTAIVAESLIANGGINMDDMAKRHADAYNRGDLKKYGAGGTTRKALKNLSEGMYWSESGIEGGAGNGIAMKVAPLGAFIFAEFIKLKRQYKGERLNKEWNTFYRNANKKIIALSLMTHRTRMAAASGLAQVEAISSCFMEGDEKFFPYFLINGILTGSLIGDSRFFIEGEEKDELSERIEKIRREKIYDQMDIIQLAELFGGATSYVYNSLPFCYAAFLKNPKNIETLYAVVNAGGDTDTNGSIVGSLLGALNGTKIFPQHLIDGLWRKEEILDLAERFCHKFGIED